MSGERFSEARHTPGPWHVAGVSGEWINDSHNMNICRVNPDVRLTPSGKYIAGNKPQAANARLIAAAPDLLEAAKEALESGAVSPRLDRLEYEKLERAIAKAEGRE